MFMFILLSIFYSHTIRDRIDQDFLRRQSDNQIKSQFTSLLDTDYVSCSGWTVDAT